MKFFLIFVITLISIYAGEFPLRSKYKEVKHISKSDLNKQLKSFIVIDVRSAFEFNVIHIKGSKNVSISKRSFITKLTKIAGGDKNKKIVTYCNGHTCAKSYKSALTAMKEGFKNIFAYDAGIFDWAKEYPNDTVLLGVNPSDPSKIISSTNFKKRILKKEDFEKQAKTAKAFLIDARDPNQVKKTPAFAQEAKKFDMDKLIKLVQNPVFKEKTKDKTFYIFDAVGKQVQWLQYHLEANDIKNYYFLEKGIWSYYGAQGASK